MGYLLDTDVLIALERGADPEVLDARLGDGERAISVITVSELLHGIHRAGPKHRAPRRAFVEYVLAGLPAIPTTSPVASVHSEVSAELAATGQAVGTHDLWIAATAITHGLTLVSGNEKDYRRVPGLTLLAVVQ